MATTKRKIVEMFQVILKTEENSVLTFEDVLLSKAAEEYEAYLNEKDVSLTVLEKGDNIIGIVETTRKHNIPPKRNTKKKKTEALGLQPGEGLGFGNVFMYEKKRKILLYEVNKFGCYVDYFLKFLVTVCEEDNRWTERFGVDVTPILKPDEYKRMKKMDYYKSIEIQFANPTSLQKEYAYENDSLANAIELGKTFQSDKMTCKFEVKSTMRDIITKAKSLLKTEVGSKSLKKLTVFGYSKDEDGGERLEPIDLLADRYIKHINLNEPAENIDLLEGQRKSEIKKLYKECLPDFKEIFG
jgi:hypothetical protein